MSHPASHSTAVLQCGPLIEGLFEAIQLGSGCSFALVAPDGTQLLPVSQVVLTPPLTDNHVDGEISWRQLDVAPGQRIWVWARGCESPVLDATVRSLAQIFLRYREQQAHVTTLSNLYEMGTGLSETIQLDDLLDRILRFARSMVKANSASLVMHDQVASELKMLQQNGVEITLRSTTKVEPGEDLENWLRAEGQLKRTSATEGNPAVISIPLRSQHRVVGSLTLLGTEDFAERDVQALSILAGHAANAIHNAELYGQVGRQVSELQALHHLSESLNRTVSLEDVLNQLLDETLYLLEAEQASVMLLEPDLQTLTIKMARGLPDEVVKQTRVKLGERISGKVAALRKPMLYAGSAQEASALCVPLLKDDQVLGVLNVRHKRHKGDFNMDELLLAARFANVAALSISKAGLHQELRDLFTHSIKALANAIDARDPYTSGHSERVTRFSVAIAERLGFAGESLEDLRYASLLHDIGKIQIRDHILHKPGKLTDEEFAEMKRHPEYGVDIMRPVRAFERILPYMLYHHERFDGRGYPTGLSGSDIPLQARIMCVADCFDAMTSDRPYRRGMPPAEAAEELRRFRGTQFDPQVVDVFLQLLAEGKVSDIVEPRAELSEPLRSHAS
jgi:HD-GYP domain-containing protein (c-di-GMP phosphodiesterase class II)